MLSRLTGLLRVAVLAYAVGRASLADTYNLANSTPNIVYELILGGVLSATLVPLFVEHLENRDDRATAALFTVAMSALAVLTAIAMLFAPLIAHLYALDTTGSERAAQLHVMTVFTLWFLPQMFFYGLTALATALLNAHRRFVAAAFAPVVNNLLVIGVLVVFAQSTAGSRAQWIDVRRISGDAAKLTLLGAGTTAGIAAMALVLVPALRHARIRLRLAFDWRHPAVTKMLRLSGWTVGYVIANQVALLFVLVLAKSGTTGSVSAYLYAYAFFQVPHGLLAVSIMTTMMPELSRSAARGDFAALAYRFRVGLRYLLLLMLPAALLFVTLAHPMLDVLVRGGFRPHDAAVTAETLQALSIGLVSFSVYLYTLRGFYALHDTFTPFWINAVENGVNVVLGARAVPLARCAGSRARVERRVHGGRGARGARAPPARPASRRPRRRHLRPPRRRRHHRARDRCRCARSRDRVPDGQPRAARHRRSRDRGRRRLSRCPRGDADARARSVARSAPAEPRICRHMRPGVGKM